MRLALISDCSRGLRACRRLARQLRQVGVEVTLITAPRLPHGPGSPRPAPASADGLLLEPLVAAASELLAPGRRGRVPGCRGGSRSADCPHQAARLRGQPRGPCSPVRCAPGAAMPWRRPAAPTGLRPDLPAGSAQLEELGWLMQAAVHADQAGRHRPVDGGQPNRSVWPAVHGRSCWCWTRLDIPAGARAKGCSTPARRIWENPDQSRLDRAAPARLPAAE
jgi:hypothetical protein